MIPFDVKLTAGQNLASSNFGSDFLKQSLAQTLLGRLGQPGNIASVAVFLASDDAAWLTSEQIYASGGSR